MPLTQHVKAIHLRRGAVPVRLLLVVLLAMTWAGCEKMGAMIGRSTIPDLGPPIPATVKIQFDPSLTKALLQYTNACNSPQNLRVGAELETTLLQAAHQTFKTVYVGGKTPPNAKVDMEVLFGLQQSGFNIQTDGIYDRLPADLTLEVAALFRDSSGKILLEQPYKVKRQEKLILEPTQHRCEYVNADQLLHDVAVIVSTQFIRQARTLMEDYPSVAAAETPEQPAAQTLPPVASQAGPAGLSFKVTVLDENGNSILEGGERVKLRVDLVNAGTEPVRGVAVTLTGSPAVVSQFPATTLPVGALQSGEARSVEFVTTLPMSVQAQRAELQVAAMGASGTALATQTLAVALKPGGGGRAGAATTSRVFDDVDQVPTAPAGFQRPQTYLVAVGISSYRDQQMMARKYASRDAELVAAYFQSLGGVPAANVRVLQDRKALRPDIEEALLDWLPPRVSAESVVIVYFSGQAKVSPSGEMYLVPYEGGNSSARLYPLKDLQAALVKLKAQHAVLIFDGSVSQLGGEGQGKPKAPQWEVGANGIVRMIGTSGLQAGLEPEQLRHGLYTYYLLRGMKGEADANRNGEITLGELTLFLGQTVPAAARSQFSQDQRPLVLPPLSPASQISALPLAKASQTR
jgi:hypothetical protein